MPQAPSFTRRRRGPRRLVLTIGMGALILLPAACQTPKRASGSTSAAGPAWMQKQEFERALRAPIATVAEQEGQILVEIPLGSDDGLTLGSFLRVYAAEDKDLLKGMVQVTEIFGDHAAIARQIGLNDRQNPIAIGDEVREVLRLKNLMRADEIEEAAREEQEAIKATDERDRRAFENLRDNYQNELARIQAEHQLQIDLLRQEHAAAIAELEADHQRALDRQDETWRADVAALKVTLAEETREAIREDRAERDQQIRQLQAERVTLQDQVAQLFATNQELSERVEALVAEIGTREARYERELRAEVEVRNALQAKLRRIEARLAGEDASEPIQLTNDELRNETVLGKISRLTATLEMERQRAARLAGQLELAQSDLETNRQQVAQMRERLDHLEGFSGDLTALQNRIHELEQLIERARAHRDAQELARLESERTLFELAAQIMDIDSDHPQVQALQAALTAHLRDRLDQTREEEDGQP